MWCISIVRYFHFTIFQAPFLVSLLSPAIAPSFNMRVPFSLSRIVMPGLFVKEASADRNCWFHKMIILLLLLSSSSLLTSSSSSWNYKIKKMSHASPSGTWVSQEEWTKLRESVPYVELYRYNPKHLYPKLNGYGDNGQRSLKFWQLLHTYWLPNTY